MQLFGNLAGEQHASAPLGFGRPLPKGLLLYRPTRDNGGRFLVTTPLFAVPWRWERTHKAASTRAKLTAENAYSGLIRDTRHTAQQALTLLLA